MIKMISLNRLVYKKRSSEFIEYIKGKKIVGIDPGATTGVTVFNGLDVVSNTQLITGKGEDNTTQAEVLVNNFELLFKGTDYIVMEDYRVYGTHADTHIGIRLYTPELIGMIKFRAYELNIPIYVQSASQAKAFFTNDKLRQWGFIAKKGGHATNHWLDAVRHVLYFLVFNKDIIIKKGEC